jgi:hypothetical protein
MGGTDPDGMMLGLIPTALPIRWTILRLPPLPWCNTEAMNTHLAEISATVDPGAHAVLILDRAGWHPTAKLRLPDNITILPLPPKAPELNPVENV